MLVIANPNEKDKDTGVKKVQVPPVDVASFKFNYQGAVDYARAHVGDENEFEDDCTNFVSKCWLKGGQVPEDPGGWFNHDMDKPNTYQHLDHMAAWTSAPAFKRYMLDKGYVEIVQDTVVELLDTETNETKWSHLFFAYASLGDVIQLWNGTCVTCVVC